MVKLGYICTALIATNSFQKCSSRLDTVIHEKILLNCLVIYINADSLCRLWMHWNREIVHSSHPLLQDPSILSLPRVDGTVCTWYAIYSHQFILYMNTVVSTQLSLSYIKHIDIYLRVNINHPEKTSVANTLSNFQSFRKVCPSQLHRRSGLCSTPTFSRTRTNSRIWNACRRPRRSVYETLQLGRCCGCIHDLEWWHVIIPQQGGCYMRYM